MPERHPDFFVVGTVKAGTTSLYHYLKQHPDVFVPAIKELHHFATEIDPTKFIKGYGQAANPHVAFVKSEAEYLSRYSNASHKLKGDFAPSNLWSMHAANNIRKFNPNAKIIALVRQPVERAHSHWLMDVKGGWSTKPFIHAFEDDASSDKKGWGISRLYKELGLYANALQRYYAVFPAHQILVIDHDDLSTNASLVFERVLHFLELSPHQLVASKAFNQSQLPKIAALDVVYTNRSLRKRMKHWLPTKAIDVLKQTLLSNKRVPKLALEDRQKLLSHFEADIAALGKLLNRDFTHWLR